MKLSFSMINSVSLQYFTRLLASIKSKLEIEIDYYHFTLGGHATRKTYQKQIAQITSYIQQLLLNDFH